MVNALDYRSKDPGFQSHEQQRFISLLGALSPTSKLSRFSFASFGGDVKAIGPREPLKISLSTIGYFLANWVILGKKD